MSFRTQRDLERLTLPAGKAEAFHFDARCPGLSVRIQRTGKPAFVAWYTIGGKRKRITLGASPGWISIRRAGRRPRSSTPRAMDATRASSASSPGSLLPTCSPWAA